MKKLFLIGLLTPILFISCSKQESGYEREERGTLTLSITKNVDTDVKTRSLIPLNDLAGYRIILDGPDYIVMDCPSGGFIDNLTPGDYLVTLTNLTDFTPAFSDPRYTGTHSVRIVNGENTFVAMTLTQANAGMRFIYDTSLSGAGLENITATVSQQSAQLSYTGERRDETGHFNVGEVTVSLEAEGNLVTIKGEPYKSYELAARELWTITLKADLQSAGLDVTAEIDVITTEREDELSLDTDRGNSAKTILTVIGLEGEKLTVTFADETFTTLTLNSEGRGTLAGVRGQIIKTITTQQHNTFMVGRLLGEEITIRTNGGVVALREAVEGVVPIGSVEEFILLNSDAASLAGNYLQEADLDLMSEWWRTIGTVSDPFTGCYDGNGHQISNLYIKATNRQGLFGTVKDGTIRNVHIANGSVEGNDYVAAICGYLDGISLIENCTNNASVSAARCVGGIVGEISSSARAARVSGCVNRGNVHGSYGGAGIAAAGSGIIDNCVNYGNVSGNQWTGGISSNSSARITSCVNHGNIVSYGNGTGCSGGIIGRGYNVVVTACYNTGIITGELNIGGIAGHFYKTSTGDAARISACYNIGKVKGTTGEGSICGDVGDGGLFESCYWYSVKNSADTGIGNTDTYQVKKFSEQNWPTVTDANWGIGDDAETGKFWKTLGQYDSMFPKLFRE